MRSQGWEPFSEPNTLILYMKLIGHLLKVTELLSTTVNNHVSGAKRAEHKAGAQ